MIRDVTVLLKDILECIKKIELFTKSLTKDKFLKNELRQSAVVRQIEIIGEATKNIPDSFREKYPEVEWKEMAGTKDIMIHAYFKVNLKIVWKIIKESLPILKKQIKEILEKEN